MPQRFCHISARNHTLLFCVWLMERGTSEQLTNAKDGYPLQRVAKPAQERNGINGGAPRSGVEAVYAGFDLDQA